MSDYSLIEISAIISRLIFNKWRLTHGDTKEK